MSDIFRHADKSLMLIYREVGREFQSLGTQLGFDELNVLETQKTVKAMYKRLDAVIRREYYNIALMAFFEAWREASEIGIETENEDDDFDAHNFVVSELEAYDPLTDFVYTREYDRKRDRLFESIIATQIGNQEMRRNLKRGMDVLARQIRQYADNITVRARITAFKRAGVRYGRWITERDERVCSVCRDRDGVVYPIDEILNEIPAHWRCRCKLVAATEEDYLMQSARKDD